MNLQRQTYSQTQTGRYANLLLMSFLALFLVLGSTSCNSAKKKAEAEAAAKKAAAIKKATTDLNALLGDESMSADQLEKKLNDIKARKINNPDIAALIKKVEQKVQTKKVSETKKALEDILNDNSLSAAEKQKKLDAIKAKGINNPDIAGLISKVEANIADKKKIEAEAQKKVEKVKTIHDYFGEIAGAGSTDHANTLINDALNLFSSPDANVLIIIAGSGDNADYDKPTTIKKYLNYLKDQKKAPTKIEDFKKDASGKIKTLILRKL